jgi:hypothetical protein
MASMLDEEKLSMIELRTDGGPEFKKEFTKLMASRKIKLTHGEPRTHYLLARTDRFHRTLRSRLGEHFQRANTHEWVSVLPAVIENYNNTPHTTLSRILGKKTAPSKVTPAEEERIHAFEGSLALAARKRSDSLGIEPGVTQVRLLARNTKAGQKDSFAKSQGATWTEAVYTVKARNGPNSWVVDVPHGEVAIWPSYTLRIVKKALASKAKGKRVDIKVERAKRMETRNISSAEQKAALKAPARAKRVPKPSSRLVYPSMQ